MTQSCGQMIEWTHCPDQRAKHHLVHQFRIGCRVREMRQIPVGSQLAGVDCRCVFTQQADLSQQLGPANNNK